MHRLWIVAPLLLLIACDALPVVRWRVADLEHRPARRERVCVPMPRPQVEQRQASSSACFFVELPPMWEADLIGYNMIGTAVAWREVPISHEVFARLRVGQRVQLRELRGEPPDAHDSADQPPVGP